MFYQPGDLYRLMTEDERALLIENTARNMCPATENLKYRHAAQCYKADPEYGTRLAEAMGLDAGRVEALSKVSEDELRKATWSV